MSTATSTTSFDAKQLRDWLAHEHFGKNQTRLLFEHGDQLKQPVLAEPVAAALQEALTAGLKLATIEPGRRQVPNAEETLGRAQRLGLTIRDFTRESPGLQTVVAATTASWAQDRALSQRIIETGMAIHKQRSQRDVHSLMERTAASEGYWHLTAWNLGLSQPEGFATAALLIEHGLLHPELRTTAISADVLKKVSFAATPEEARKSFATSLEHVTHQRSTKAGLSKYTINHHLLNEVRRLQGEFTQAPGDGGHNGGVSLALQLQLWSDYSHKNGALSSTQTAFDQLTPAQRVSPGMDAWWGRQFRLGRRNQTPRDWTYRRASGAGHDVTYPLDAFASQDWDARSLERVVPVILSTGIATEDPYIGRYFGKVAVALVDEGSLPNLFEHFAHHPLPRVRQVAVGIAADRPAITQDRQWISWISDADPGLRQHALESMPLNDAAMRAITAQRGWYADPVASQVVKGFYGLIRDGRLAKRIKDDWVEGIVTMQPMGLGVTPSYGYSSMELHDAIQLLRSAPDDVVVLSTIAHAFARGARHLGHLHRVAPKHVQLPDDSVADLIGLLPWSDEVRDSTRLLSEIRPAFFAPILMENGDVTGVMAALERSCVLNKADPKVDHVVNTIGDTATWLLRRDDRSEHLPAISAALHQGSEDISFIGDYVDSVQAGGEKNRFLTSLRRRKQLKMFLGVASVLRPGSTPFGMEVTKVAATFMQHPDPGVAEQALAITLGS